MPCPEKFKESLIEFNIHPQLVSQINAGYEELVSRSPKKIKAAYFQRAIELMDQQMSFNERYQVLDFNACCKGGAREKAVKAFIKENQQLSLAEKIQKVHMVQHMGNPTLNGDGTLTTGIYWQVDGVYKCPCPNFNGLKDTPKVSKTYCLCCGGHFRHHYQNMLGIKLKTKEIVSSPLESGGKEPCIIVFEIVE